MPVPDEPLGVSLTVQPTALSTSRNGLSSAVRGHAALNLVGRL
jgi:hypothetical protein